MEHRIISFTYLFYIDYTDDLIIRLCYNNYMKTVIKYLIITFAVTYVCWWGVAALVAYTDFVYGDALPHYRKFWAGYRRIVLFERETLPAFFKGFFIYI